MLIQHSAGPFMLDNDQGQLKANVIEEDTQEWQSSPSFVGLERVGGVDLSYVKGDDRSACASLVVLSYPDLQVTALGHGACLNLKGKGVPLTLSLVLSDSGGWCSSPFLSQRAGVVCRCLLGHGMTAWNAISFPLKWYLLIYSHLHVFEVQKLGLTAGTHPVLQI
uniref:Uncharacterized protein n=1 Tax=Anolis carolinensis TaxID=28377 RepID=A0A803SW55_ANOCA